jgi:hypothetical protein
MVTGIETDRSRLSQITIKLISSVIIGEEQLVIYSHYPSLMEMRHDFAMYSS